MCMHVTLFQALSGNPATEVKTSLDLLEESLIEEAFETEKSKFEDRILKVNKGKLRNLAVNSNDITLGINNQLFAVE